MDTLAAQIAVESLIELQKDAAANAFLAREILQNAVNQHDYISAAYFQTQAEYLYRQARSRHNNLK